MRAFLFALLISCGILAVVLSAVRRRAIRDQMAVLWIAIGVAMVALSFTVPFNLLDRIAHAVGVHYGSDLILLAAIVFLVLLVFQLSVMVAKLAARTTRLSQELGLLRHQVAATERDAPRTGSSPA